MKIVNVTPGLIQIPPNGWGAIEKIIWEIHNNLLMEGHDSQILYLDDVPEDADIVHIHVANLALQAHERGIPYYFTMHDHHAYLYGQDSDLYKQNLLAMQHAIKAFVPAKYLVDYFKGVPQYFSHGVNTEYFATTSPREQHKLLCVANNGYAYDQKIDRKGFGIAITAAEKLGLPITIAGPSNNKNYFSANPSSYEKLTVLYDLNESELLSLYKTHTIFVHPSQLEAGHPNLTLLEALSCGLPVVGTFEQNNSLQGMVITDAVVKDVTDGILDVIENYPEYSTVARQQAQTLSWNNRTKELLAIYSQNTSMRNKLLKHYNNTMQLKKDPITKLNFNNIDGMFAEVIGGPDVIHKVRFINKETNRTEYSVDLNKNCWARTGIKYFIDWKVELENSKTKKIYTHHLNLDGNRVYISLDSKSLGDTLAWFPYVEEFRKKHNCKVICSTFLNKFFKETYPEIEFVEPGAVVHNITAMYVVGIFYGDDGKLDMSRHRNNPLTMPLQAVAADILGLEYKEIKPLISSPTTPDDDSKQVTIAMHSTAQAKYWNNPEGWQKVVDWLVSKGYTVKLLSSEGLDYMGNKAPTGVVLHPNSSIEDVMIELKKSKLFIGISSGLSWLSWALNVPTVIISGFTDPITEMESCIRISAPTGKCSGCWNRHKFNPGDWNWCPDHKGTSRQFECSSQITDRMVISQLEQLVDKLDKEQYTKMLLKNYSTWEGHGIFAMNLVDAISPSVVVDLGVDTGYSTFCLAYPKKGTVYGIDSFEGDIHSGFRNVLPIVENVYQHIKSVYGISNIKIIKGYFDDIAKNWTTPIDILHIDGLHTYEAVKNDFEIWSKFCTEESVILFHDVESFSDTVGRFFSELGGYKLIKTGSAGLGIYTKSKNRFELIKSIL